MDFLGESTEGNLHIVDSAKQKGVITVFGMRTLDDIYTLPLKKLKSVIQARACLRGHGRGVARQGSGQCHYHHIPYCHKILAV